ncbi:MAG: methylenetetrahydrofolate dehydrogenase (NADP+) / methenyltetrahydrofolate cyclohydrolase [Parcubacteria group bacterium Gr01-1014_2]|nr:MAG: methylenetetrahydrofolate dehydrogenase (NADP+) / methenyltetrahydrofolate cyclohydrolase [Parcubacteria group bacterium Gr01-1014_2]
MIINGRKIAQKILEALRQAQGKKLRLVGVLVGQNPELKKFIELKKKAAEEIGVEFKAYEFPENISNNQLREELNKIVKVKTTHGVIIELPLPSHLNTQYLLNTIPEEKDVDVLSEKSQGKFYSGKSKILPPSVEAVKQIFEEYNVGPKGKTAAVFGYGLLVGRLVSYWLVGQGATVSIITEFTKDADKISKEADIIITGVGKQNLITEEMVKEGVVIIDFGKDADFENVSRKAGLITPPVGGIGPIVVASVLKNLVGLNT